MPLLSWRILVGFNPSKIECFLRSQWMFIACFSCHISQTLRRSSLLTVTTTFIFLVVWIVLCLGPNLFESLVNSMCRYPVGVSPLISHHNPAVIPTLWREGICHLAACFPLLSQEWGWALIYCEVSPGSLNLHAYQITEWRKRLTTRMTFSWRTITQAGVRTD